MAKKQKRSHTPGPWALSVGWKIVGPDYRPGLEPIAYVNRAAYVKGTEDANASLIAASPDLLRLLERILGMHESGNNGLYNGEAILSRSVADEIRWAIAKAEGRKVAQ